MPDNSIGWEIKTLSCRIRRMHDEAASRDGLTGMQGFVIMYVSEHPNEDVYQRDLEKELKIRRSSITGILQNMERDGLIVRDSVKSDARLKKITLTGKAAAYYRNSACRFDEIEAVMRAGLTDEEVEAFFTIARKINRNLEVRPQLEAN